jgi:hypothetical protein
MRLTRNPGAQIVPSWRCFFACHSQDIKLLIDEDDVETSAFGILYSVSLISFLQARPAGSSITDYREKNLWPAEDLHRHISFRHGKLHFHADYVCGRLMKTTVEISKDGSIVIETLNRADQATQWVEFLLGKRRMLDFISEEALGTVQ